MSAFFILFVIPQVRTITRYGGERCIVQLCGTHSLVKQSEQSPVENVSRGDWLRRAEGTVQTGSHDTYLIRFALSYGMTWSVMTKTTICYKLLFYFAPANFFMSLSLLRASSGLRRSMSRFMSSFLICESTGSSNWKKLSW